MTDDRKQTEKLLPVLIGQNYEHVMAKATIVQIAAVKSPSTGKVLGPSRVIITIEAEGATADILGEYVAAAEPVALSFTGIPVQPRNNHNEE